MLAGAPTVGGGNVPAAALWWDGFTIAKNISDEDAEASFRAMVYGIRPEVGQSNPDAATWLIKDYKPGPGAVGVLANATGGAKPYPMVPYMGLLHTALGAELGGLHAGPRECRKCLEGRRSGLLGLRQGRRLSELASQAGAPVLGAPCAEHIRDFQCGSETPRL